MAGVPCHVLHYEVSERILCRTARAPSPMRAPIRITIGRAARRIVQSADSFDFRAVAQPRSVQPSFGPRSGGTRLELFGTALDVGRNASVHLDNLQCTITERDVSVC